MLNVLETYYLRLIQERIQKIFHVVINSLENQVKEYAWSFEILTYSLAGRSMYFDFIIFFYNIGIMK